MSRVPSLSSPFLLGFDEIERALDRVAKASDGYPPYNIERVARENGKPERLRITLAVAGFNRDELDVTVEESQLVIRGRQLDDKTRQYLARSARASRRRPDRLRQADQLRAGRDAVSAGAEDRAGHAVVRASCRRRHPDHADRHARGRGRQRMEPRAGDRERALSARVS